MDSVEKTEGQSISKGFGQDLKDAREARGMSVFELSMSTNILVPKIEALENEEIDKLPEPVYVRAFIRTISKTLGVENPETIVAKYMAKVGGATDIAYQIPKSNPRRETPLEDPQTASKIKVFFCFLILIAVGVAIWAVYTDKFSNLHEGSEAQQVEAQIPEEALRARQAIEDAKAQGVLPSSSEEIKAIQEPSTENVSEPELAPAKEEVATTEEVRVSTLSDAAEHKITIKVNQPCWIQVSTPEGKRIIAREMKKDDSFSFTAPKGSRFTIGNTNAAYIEVDGAPYDFSTVVRKGVARFILQ